MTSFELVLKVVNGFVWGIPALIMILGIGIYLSVKSGFAQIRLFPKALKNFCQKIRSSDKETGISSYRSLCTALSATVGTGNIAGVAGAIALGGPGAVFWMWICALLGMITKFAEATLAVHFQKRMPGGKVLGGPMYMIEHGLGKRFRWLGCTYAFLGVVAAFGVGNATQVNSVLDGLNTALLAFGIKGSPALNLLIAFLLAIITASCLLGGAGRIGALAEKLVPVAACGYIGLGILVLIICRHRIPNAFCQIISGAFSPEAVSGGAVGSLMVSLRVGVSRGVFTNEAGMGTAAISYASSNVDHPVEQGLMGIMEVFIDTIVICTVTALVILCSKDAVTFGVDEGAALTSRAFCSALGGWASIMIAVFLGCFAFATMLGWGMYGASCAQYLFGPSAWRFFACIQAVVVTVSAVLNTGTIWLLADTMNGLMAIPNLIALFGLSPVLIGLVTDYSTYIRRRETAGGTYESFNQCKPLRTFSYEKVSPSCCRSREKRKEDLPLEYRSARSGNT